MLEKINLSCIYIGGVSSAKTQVTVTETGFLGGVRTKSIVSIN